MLSKLLARVFGSAPSSSTSGIMSGSVPNPPPEYVYKILETATTDPRYHFPIPIPASHRFRDTPLDEKDGFVHMSTSKQVPDTLNRFFANHEEVVLLRLDYKRLSGWKDVRWEGTSSGQTFPHLYGYGIEGEMVDSFKDVKREKDGEKLTGWDAALKKLEDEGWLVY